MKRRLLILLITLVPPVLHAQVDYTVDSLRVANAEWRVDSLEGCVLKRYHFGDGTLFCSAQHLFVIEIPAGSPRRLAFAHDADLATTTTLAERADALAAINGSFFDMRHRHPVCYLRIDGTQVGENTPHRSDSINRKYYQHAVLTLAGNQVRLLVPDSNRRWEESLGQSDIMTAGPMLLRQGQYVPQRDDRTFVTHRHNRTALGTKPDGTTLLLVADGRFAHKAEGLTLTELERVMRWLGCTEAINLDGGGSSTMYIKDKGVVNYPSDNGRHDHEGERPVNNAILVL